MEVKNHSCIEDEMDTTSRPNDASGSTSLIEGVHIRQLNDRLALYIERVRQLEAENARLLKDLQRSRSLHGQQLKSLKASYEMEVHDMRLTIDNLAKENAVLGVEYQNIQQKFLQLYVNCSKKNEELVTSKQSFDTVTEAIGKMELYYQEPQMQIDEYKKVNESLQEDNANLSNLLEETCRVLDVETLQRVNYENQVTTLKEEFDFQKKIVESELADFRSSTQEEVALTDDNCSLKNAHLIKDYLQDFRHQYEHIISESRAEVQKIYEKKLAELEDAAACNSQTLLRISEDLRKARRKIADLEAYIAELEVRRDANIRCLEEIKKKLEEEQEEQTKTVSSIQQELSTQREENKKQLQEYHQLKETELLLKMEIANYDKLLRFEEDRLKSSPAINSQERKKSWESDREMLGFDNFSTISTMAKGPIEISKIDPNGLFVELLNTAHDRMNLAGWRLMILSADRINELAFLDSNSLECKETLTVWAEEGVNDSKNIYLFEKKWTVNDNMKVKLLNADGAVVALAQSKRFAESLKRKLRDNKTLKSQHSAAKRILSNSTRANEGTDRCVIS